MIGAVATLFFSRSAVYGYDQRCEIFGTEGLVSVGNVHQDSSVVSSQTGIHRSCLQHSFPQRFQLAFQRELDAFCNVVLKDEEWPVTVEQCIRVQQIVDAARESSETGHAVKIC